MKTISSHDATKISFAESLLQKKKFRFQKRNGRLDLRGLREIDVNKVINEMDVDTLQRYLENLTYSEVCADDFHLYSKDCLVRLFQVAQLTLEYLLNVQDTLAINLNSLAAKYASQKREMRELQALISEKERIKSEIYDGSGECVEPSTDKCSKDPGKYQNENLSKHVQQMCCLLTSIRDGITNDSKRIFEDGIEKKVESILRSLACQQRDSLSNLGEHVIRQCKECTDNCAAHLLQSIIQYLSRHQCDTILLALETYEKEKLQERCHSMIDKETESYDLHKDNERDLHESTHGTLRQAIGKSDTDCLETATDNKSSHCFSSPTHRKFFKSNLKRKKWIGVCFKDMFLPCRHRKGFSTHHIKSMDDTLGIKK